MLDEGRGGVNEGRGPRARELALAEPSHFVILSIGSNLGDRLGNLRAGLARVEDGGSLAVEAVSSVYASDPIEAAGGEFLNVAVAARTALEPASLLAALKAAEQAAGRTGSTTDPRPLDLDILYFDDLVSALGQLRIPHPRRLDRPFVLVPLAEVCGDARDPETGGLVADEVAPRLAGALRSVRRVAGPEWWKGR